MIIKVLTVGCKKCADLDLKIKEIAGKNGYSPEIIKITDYQEIASYGVLASPGIIINNKTVSVGVIPTEQQILKWLKDN